MKQLNYKDLFNQWLESHEQAAPQGMEPIRQRDGAPKGYFLKPDDMQALANANSPFDLYTRPDQTPILMDYPTSALNIHNQDGLGVDKAIVLNSEEPKKLTNLISVLQSSKDNYQQEEQPYAAQGIYEHEVGHFLDPRLKQYDPNRNDGYIKRWGLEGDIGSRETPGIREEDRYWDRMRGFLSMIRESKKNAK